MDVIFRVERNSLHHSTGMKHQGIWERVERYAFAPSTQEQERTMATNDAGQLAFDIGDPSEPEGYRGPTVCKIVGITYRQLDYWARTELVAPSYRKAEGSGTQRLYSFDDVVRLKVVKRLLDSGVSLQKVRLAVDELHARGQGLAETTLISDGTTVYAMDDDQQLLDLVKRGQAVFAIALDPVVEELRGEVTAFPTERVTRADATPSPTRVDQDAPAEPPVSLAPVADLSPR
jgi:DNA-binding transcriptional MerR regulator